ncbi:hypothetical protein XELAEV_18012899mg [Xenopus laevis]|uniref:Uncharacterized protein n=1 Tax=Xenopus laevis TaxID=8355 RepID=A0A974DNG8_XENLA|nr:hypothetical protein XELAEV_18012899mg [Xenopus laevis]
MDPTRDQHCTRDPHCTVFHMVWKCPKLTRYWMDIFSFISKVLVLPIQPDPSLALLGHTGGVMDSVESRTLLQLLMFYASKLIVLRWNRLATPKAPHRRDDSSCRTTNFREARPILLNYRAMEEWKELVKKALPCYKAVYMSRGCTDKFIAIWMVWVLNYNTNSPNVF